ncbi:MAG: hypothetical protein RLY71_133 [Pseudomonadota bacterium]|jgi:diguanylate cyclase (GGDEF)-like protein
MATVLVVDDHAINRELLVALLTYSGHRAIEAADGEEALAAVRAERPDLVICDILMPTMDGYEFVRRLRADAEIAATEVIFHSATFLEHEASKLARACGVSRVLVKPCEPEVFLDVVAQALVQRAPSGPTVDDSNFDREHLRLMTDKLLVKADELEHANRRLSALTDLNLQLASEHHPHTLLDKVCRGACELIGARGAMLCVRNGRDTAELYRSTWGLDPADVARLPPPELAAGLFGQVLAGRTARRFVNPAGDPVAAGLPAGFPALQSGLVAPIVSLQHCYGWVLLLDRRGAPEFSADDEHLLAILAAQSGRIYENGSLYARVQQQLVELQAEMAERLRAEARIERLHHVATLLSEVNSLIVRVRDRSELFDEACRIAVEVGRFGQAWIGLIQADAAADLAPALQLVSAAGLAPAELVALRQALAGQDAAVQALFAPACRTQQAQVCGDAVQLRRLGLISAGLPGAPALVALPLVAAGATVALLVLQADSAAVFDAEEMKLLGELAGDMSFALEHIAQAEKLNYLAYYDALTGQANAMLFNDRLAQFIASAAAGPQRLALALIDLVRFKTINDTLGRHVGDRLLKQVAERLEHCVGDRSHLARIGSDHFAVVFPEIRSESELVRTFSAQYRSCFGAPFRIDGAELRVTAKTGIALFPNDGHDVETLYRNAEAAVKQAKASNEPVLFYNPRMTESVAERLALENRLRGALEHDELVLHYQPKVDLTRRRIEGVEALLRWHSPDAGLVQPACFIPLLEETGLILDAGLWALRRAAQDHRRWQQQGLEAPRIAVNVSAAQLYRPDFVASITEALQGDAISAGVDVEITESQIMQDVGASVEKLHLLRDMGVNLSIDDFGTGYSSLAYLARLPAQMLKIDKAFIDTMLTEPNHMTLVSTMISLAHSLGMKVIAEGVETEEQARMLRLLHCDQMQGYLVSRPVPFDALAGLLSRRTGARAAARR